MNANEIDTMYANTLRKLGFVSTPLHSRALMPKTEAKKEGGEKMMVKTVKTMIERDESAAFSVCSCEILIASFCFMSRSSLKAV